MSGNCLFDTNAIVSYMQGLAPVVDFIDNLTAGGRFISVITRMELLSFPGIAAREEEAIHRFLGDLDVIPLNEAVENAAIAIRRTVRLKLPDAIVAATALTLNATLITSDQRLVGLTWPGLRVADPA